MTAIQYELTADDFVEFNHFHHKHSPELRRRLLVSRIVIPLFMISALLLTPLLVQRNDRGYLDSLTQLRWFFAVPPVLFFYAPFAWKRRQARLIRRMLNEGSTRSLLGNCLLTLNDDSISVQRPSSLSTYGWEATDQIRVTSEYCFIYVTSISAIILPRRAFNSNEAFDDFVREIRQHLSRRAITPSMACR